MNTLGIGIVALLCLGTGLAQVCPKRARLGDDCQRDRDCVDKASICTSTSSSSQKTCQCHPSFEQYNTQNALTGQVPACRKLPDREGAECTSKCKQPLTCNRASSECECVRCNEGGKIGDFCDDDTSCTTPFSECRNKKCECVTGRSGSNCATEKKCPDNTKGGKQCQLKTSDFSEISQTINSGGQLDDCDSGEFCVTDGESMFGHCCKMSCPYGQPRASQFSVEAGASNPCPTSTHFVHHMAGPSFAYAACCPLPCPNDRPVLVGNECLPAAARNGKCESDVQCNGGFGMECFTGNTFSKRQEGGVASFWSNSNSQNNNAASSSVSSSGAAGTCQCKSGFIPSRDPLRDGFCDKRCNAQNSVAVEERCVERRSVGQTCEFDVQCPGNATCAQERCQCNCNYELVGSKCISSNDIKKPETSTGSSGTGNGNSNNGLGGLTNLIGSLGGNGANGGGNAFTNIFGSLGGNSGSSGGSNPFGSLAGLFGGNNG